MTWFLVNFGLGLIPFAIYWLIEQNIGENTFANFLTFGYTLIVSSTYLFSNYRNRFHVKEFLIVLSAVSGLILIIIFLMHLSKFPLVVFDFFSFNQPWSLIIILVGLVVLSYFLNRNSLEDVIARLEAQRFNEEQEEQFEDLANEVENEI